MPAPGRRDTRRRAGPALRLIGRGGLSGVLLLEPLERRPFIAVGVHQGTDDDVEENSHTDRREQCHEIVHGTSLRAGAAHASRRGWATLTNARFRDTAHKAE